MQPLESLPSWSLHCTVRLCQPVSQVLEQVIQRPVTHLGPGGSVEGTGPVVDLRTKAAGVGETEVVLIVVDLAVVDVVVVLCEGINFELNCCCWAVHLGM